MGHNIQSCRALELMKERISNAYRVQGIIRHLSNTRLPTEDLEIEAEGMVEEATNHQFATTVESRAIFRDSIRSLVFFLDIIEVQSMK